MGKVLRLLLLSGFLLSRIFLLSKIQIDGMKRVLFMITKKEGAFELMLIRELNILNRFLEVIVRG